MMYVEALTGKRPASVAFLTASALRLDVCTGAPRQENLGIDLHVLMTAAYVDSINLQSRVQCYMLH